MARYNLATLFVVKINIIWTILLLATFKFVVFSQDLSGLDIAKKTIEASGGEVWRRPKTLQLSGNATLYWKGKVHKLDTYKMWRVFPENNDNARNANEKVRFDAFDGVNKFFQLTFDGKNTIQYSSEDVKANEETLKWSNNFGFSIFRFC